jgi:hypothetical protein
MYVDETVLNFMSRPEYESALLKNETIEASIAFIEHLRLHGHHRNRTANGRQYAEQLF